MPAGAVDGGERADRSAVRRAASPRVPTPGLRRVRTSARSWCTGPPSVCAAGGAGAPRRRRVADRPPVRAGPVLRGAALPQAPVARVREAALPHLRRAVDAPGETATVMVVAGSDVRFTGTVEWDHILRVDDRTGRRLPTHLSSGARRCWRPLDREQLATHLEPLDSDTAARPERELRTVTAPGVRGGRPGDRDGPDRGRRLPPLRADPNRTGRRRPGRTAAWVSRRRRWWSAPPAGGRGGRSQ